MSKRAAYLYIAVAAVLWGIISVFVTRLYNLGFTSAQIVSVRALSATLFLGIYAITQNGSLPKVRLKHSPYFIGTGVISVAFFNWCMFSAIRETSVSVATILLYTAPAFVTVLSKIFFNEALSSRKIAALLLTLSGCTLVVGVLSDTDVSVSTYGIILGLGSGFFYALYSIFGKLALLKYNSLTVSLYTFVFAALAITPFSSIWEAAPLFANMEAWLHIAGLGFLSTTLAYLLYTKGLQHVEASRASIMATIEPVVATLVGWLVFSEQLDVWQYAGIALVLAAVVLVQERPGKG
jgi:drug/metabolite transporter (DMT)-like permease